MAGEMEDAVALLRAGGNALELPLKSLLRGEHLQSLALHRARLQAPIFDHCTISDSAFDGCDLSNARFFGATRVESCRFTGVDFRSVGLSGAVFVDCHFVRCDFRGSRFDDCTLQGSHFDACRIIDTGLHADRVKACRFEGILRDVRFIGSGRGSSLHVDLSGCVLDGVSFEDCSLDRVIPPSDNRHRYLPDVGARAQRALHGGTVDPAGQPLLLRRLRRYAQSQGTIINVEQLRLIEGPELAEALLACLDDPA